MMDGPVMRPWSRYALAGLVVAAVLGEVVSYVVAPGNRHAVWFGATLAYVIQLGAFWALLRFRGDAQLFLLGWSAGIFARFLAVGVVAFVISQTQALPLDAALLSLVGFLVLLLFMEPLFLRGGPATK